MSDAVASIYGGGYEFQDGVDYNSIDYTNLNKPRKRQDYSPLTHILGQYFWMGGTRLEEHDIKAYVETLDTEEQKLLIEEHYRGLTPIRRAEILALIAKFKNKRLEVTSTEG